MELGGEQGRQSGLSSNNETGGDENGQGAWRIGPNGLDGVVHGRYYKR